MKLNDDITVTNTADGGFLMNKRTGDCFVLNLLGVYVWERISDGHSPSEIAASVAARFSDVPVAKIDSDVAAFLDALGESHLLVREGVA